CQQFDSDPLTF
nr:immunoglobulin light chain junction region [Macaca mulatta]